VQGQSQPPSLQVSILFLTSVINIKKVFEQYFTSDSSKFIGVS
jgi:hypothetical protein